MARNMPWQRLCDCRCPLHGETRTTYDQPRCACLITCATQPMTLTAEQWSCALFLDQDGNLWHVPAMTTGQWDWESAGDIDGRSDFYDTSMIIEHLLRLSAHVLSKSLD